MLFQECNLRIITLNAVDAVGSQMLGHNPESIEYLTLANGIIGELDNIEVVTN